MNELQRRYAHQILTDPELGHALATVDRLLNEGRKTRAQFDRLTARIKAEPDDLDKVLLICKRNGVAATIADINELLRDLRDHLKDAAA